MNLFAILISIMLVIPTTRQASLEPAKLLWTTDFDEQIVVYYTSILCHKCKQLELVRFSSADNNKTISIETYRPTYYFNAINEKTSVQLCPSFFSKKFTFGVNASYVFEIKVNKTVPESAVCTVTEVVKPPYPANLPFYILLVIIPCVWAVYYLAKFAYKKWRRRSRDDLSSQHLLKNEFENNSSSSNINMSESKPNEANQSIQKPQRIKSVDALRGLSLMMMVFVNIGGGGYVFINHVPWNGLHLADTLYPCFIFVMGMAIPLSLRALSLKSINPVTGESTLKFITLLRKLVIRCALLFFFNMMDNNGVRGFKELKFNGVLQRFAYSSLVCTLIELVYMKFNNYKYVDLGSDDQGVPWSTGSKWLWIKLKFQEIFLYPIQWVLMFVFATTWILIMFLLPVEGCPTGYLGPGGLHENGSYFNCTGGASNYLDHKIFGENHILRASRVKDVYKNTYIIDTDSLLGCLNAFVLTLMGMVIGHVIIHYQEPSKRIIRFVVYAIVWGLIALSMCGFSQDDGWIPINELLWSTSFVLINGSISLFAFTGLYLLVDVFQVFSGMPFIYLGRNSIIIYLGSLFFDNKFPLFQVKPFNANLLALHVYWTAYWTIIAFFMDYKKFYISL